MSVLVYIRMLRNVGTEMSEKPVIKQYLSAVSCINTFCIQVITSVSPPKDLWFLNIFEGCLDGKVVFYVIMSVLRQKPIML